MVIKTINLTEEAYEALSSLKSDKESFSKTILRVSKRKPLSSFFGTLSEESGKRLEKTVYELRKSRNEVHKIMISNLRILKY